MGLDGPVVEIHVVICLRADGALRLCAVSAGKYLQKVNLDALMLPWSNNGWAAMVYNEYVCMGRDGCGTMDQEPPEWIACTPIEGRTGQSENISDVIGGTLSISEEWGLCYQ